MRIRGALLIAGLVGWVVSGWPPAGAGTGAPLRPGLSQVHSDFNGDGISDLAVGASWETVHGRYAAGGVNVLYGSPSGLKAVGNQFWTQDSAGVSDMAEEGDNFGSGLATGDFDGDGFADLAVGSPNERIGSRFSSGSVTVLFGSTDGLSGAGSQVIPGAMFDDQFGYSLTSGDFDQDGYSDLAGGLPFRTIDGVLYAGAVEVMYGSSAGLNAQRPQLWSQDSPGVPDESEDGDALGWSVATGDFDGDGAADLAASAYEESFDDIDEAGTVTVLYGSPEGLTSTGSQLWSQDSPNILDTAEDDDEFGYFMTAADLNGDGSEDLAVGSFGESLGNATFCGSVNVIYGSAAGLTAIGNQFWTEASPGVPGDPGVVDRFGSALSGGDFNGDGILDLAAGAPGKAVGTFNAGAAIVLYGSPAGLAATGAQLWSQNSPGIKDVSEGGDFWGGTVVSGDWNGDGHDDLSSAAIYESTPQQPNYPGAVNTIYGTSDGLDAAGNQLWTQNSPGVLDRAEADDFFGYAMA
jgi:hypothetical protein